MQSSSIKSKNRDWRISLMEWPVPFNQEADVSFFGKRFSHPFLVLRDSSGGIVEELHAKWELKHDYAVIKKLLERFHRNILTQDVQKRYNPYTSHFLPKVFLFAAEGVKLSNNAEFETELIRGSEPKIKSLWSDMKDSSDMVSRLRIPFYHYASFHGGFANCQVALRMVLNSIDRFEKVPDLNLAQTGWSVNYK